MSKLELAAKTFLAELIRWVLHPPATPGPFALTVIGETITGSTLIINHDEQVETKGEIVMKKNITVVTLPAVADGNPEGVVNRKFSVVSGTETVLDAEYALPAGAVNVDPVTVKLAQGVEATLTLVDVDQAGNSSSPDVLVFTPTDVTPPSQPGVFGVAVTGEVDE